MTAARSQSHRPKKHLGQNFLIDRNIQQKILNACDIKSDETILEIGPGLGAITGHIATRAKKVIAIETDLSLIAGLKEKFGSGNVEIIHADFLKYPVNNLPAGLKVIGNLPYYISTPILERIMLHPEHFTCLYATLQYELGQRIMAKPGSKTYGAFTCFVQYFMDVEMLFKIKNTSFKPEPKVHSCFLKFTRKKGAPLAPADEKLLFQIIRSAFQQRRKTIVNALSAILPAEKIKETLKRVGINPQNRAENLSLNDYIELTQQVKQDREA